MKTAKETINLVTVEEAGSLGSAAAKNIRIELKAAFPGVKFSVKQSRAGSINIDWTDGPSDLDVAAIGNQYQGGDFDGMSDCYISRRNPFSNIYGSATYVFTHRSYSDLGLQMLINNVNHKCHANITVEDWKEGRVRNQPGGDWICREMYEAMKHVAL